MATTQTKQWVPADSLANRLILVRLHLGLTQREAAERTGLTFGEWQSMESGRKARGLDVKIAKISRALGVRRDWLMWGGPLDTPGGYDQGGLANTQQYLPGAGQQKRAA